MWQMRDNSLLLLIIGFPVFLWFSFPEYHPYPYRDSDPAPVSPTNVTASIEGGDLIVNWQEVAWWRSYNVYLSSSDDFSETKRFVDVSPPVKFKDLEAGKAYQLSVTSVNWSGESKVEPQTIVVLQNEQPAVLRVRGSNHSNLLSWNKVPNANGYMIYWKRKGESDDTLTPIMVSGNRNSYRHTGLKNYQEYEYQVVVQKMQYSTGYSQRVSSRPVAGPSDLKVATGDHEIQLSWQRAQRAKSYRVYIGKSPDFDISEAKPIVKRLRSNRLRITGLENGETYYYAVTANTPLGESDRSNVVEVQPRVNTPRNLSIMVAENSHYLLWDPVAGAEKYRVYWSNDGTVDTLSRYFDVDANVPVVTHERVNSKLSYFYRIVAMDKNTQSGMSAKAASIVSRVYPPPGNYKAGQQVFLTCQNSEEHECEVYYSTDAESYRAKVTPYSEPIILDRTTEITYFAKDKSGNVGPEHTAVYKITGDSLNNRDKANVIKPAPFIKAGSI